MKKAVKKPSASAVADAQTAADDLIYEIGKAVIQQVNTGEPGIVNRAYVVSLPAAIFRRYITAADALEELTAPAQKGRKGE